MNAGKNVQGWSILIVFLTNKWKPVIIYGLGAALITVGIVLSLPLTYRASGLLLPPGNGSFAASFLPTQMTEGLAGIIGQSLGGLSGDESSKVLAILQSRSLALEAIDKFDLNKRFKKDFVEDRLEDFGIRLEAELTEEGTLSVGYSVETEWFHPDEDEEVAKKLSKDIVNFLFDRTDEIYTFLNSQQALFQQQELAKRLTGNQAKIDSLQGLIISFSKENNVVYAPDQFEAVVAMVAAVQEQVIQNEIKLAVLSEIYPESNQEVIMAKRSIQELKKRLTELKTSNPNAESASVLIGLNEIPNIAIQYQKLATSLEVEIKLKEFLTQQYEQLKIDARKDTPSLQILDRPILPEKKAKPPRGVLSVLIFGSFMAVFIVLNVLWFRRNGVFFI